MNSTLKIILALKLKFVLIVLSVGGNYLMEHHLNKNRTGIDAADVTPIEKIRDITQRQLHKTDQMKPTVYRPDETPGRGVPLLVFELEL